MASYCAFARKDKGHHKEHHNTEHGFPPKNDDDLFRRLMLEISQAGLSFDTILKKKKTIYSVFSSVNKVANFRKKDVERLMSNPGIIRNRLKIQAAIYNANKIKELQKKHGSFHKWLMNNYPQSRENWTKLFRKTFKFTGGEIVNEFMMSIGMLPGAHDNDCTVGNKIKKLSKNKF